MTTQKTPLELVRTARAALQNVAAVGEKHAAWQALQELNADGQAIGPRPYTDPAFPLLKRAFDRNPEDPDVIHHLAIAHHARAWDRELAGDATAEEDWRKAFEYWRMLAGSGGFWSDAKQRMVQFGEHANTGVLDDIRSGLMEELLDIHVGFIEHHYEQGEPARAAAHIEIVRRAPIPRVLRYRLVEKVYRVMGRPVSAAQERRDFASAIEGVERFLQLFPDHLPALRSSCEILAAWLGTLSFKDQWNEVQALKPRVSRLAPILSNHPDLRAEPLAQAALCDACAALGQHYLDRAIHLETESGRGAKPSREKIRQMLEEGRQGMQTALPFALEGSRIRVVYGASLNRTAVSFHEEMGEVLQQVVQGNPGKLGTAIQLENQAVTTLRRAVEFDPSDATFRGNLQAVQSQLTELETLQRQLGRW